MKMDKEFLKKNLFWVLLAGAFVLWFASLAMVFLGPSGDAAAAAEEFEKKEKEIKTPRKPKNASFNPPWQERKKLYEGHKNSVWEEAWKTQSDIMTWPDKFPTTMKDAYFGDEIAANQLEFYKLREYNTQFDKMEKFLNLKLGEKVYCPFEFDESAKGKLVFKEVPSDSEEPWLAQEELWARREVFHILINTLRSIGKFKEIREQNYQRDALTLWMGGPLSAVLWETPSFQAKLYKERPPKDGMKSKLFRNHSWEVELLLEKVDGERGMRVSAKSTIKNINPFERSMSLTNDQPAKGLLLRITQKNAEPRELARIDGQMLPYGSSSTFTQATTAEGIDFSKDFELEEVFERATSPIRRLEMLVLGSDAQAHRIFAGYDLVHNTQQFKGTPTPPGGAPAGAGQMGGTPPMGNPPSGTPGQPPSAGPAVPLTPNGMNRQRYVVCNQQVRKLPVAFVVVMDQAHRKDLLAAIANSKLQMHIQQVYWRHKEPPSPPKDKDPRPTIPMTPDGKEPDKKAGLESVLDRNLIELSVHAVASFYERFPAKAPPTTTPGTPPVPPPPRPQ